jgi:hypothetical protein
MLRSSAAFAVVIASAGFAQAGVATFSATEGARAASARFESSGFTLTVTLTNTASADVTAPDQVLTAVFFNAASLSAPLTPVSAMVAGGSTVLFGAGEGVGGANVGGEWAYRSGISGPRGTSYGISSSGLGDFGPSDRFPGNNLQGPESPDGLQFGITSAGDNPTTGNTPVTGTNALIKNSVVFTFTGLPAGFDVNSITSVNFQYGTSYSEPNIPAPAASVALGGLALAALRRRRSL